MPLLREEYTKEEKINGVIYDELPSPNYQHGIIDGNIYRIISTGLKGTLCLAFMENLDYKYHAQKILLHTHQRIRYNVYNIYKLSQNESKVD